MSIYDNDSGFEVLDMRGAPANADEDLVDLLATFSHLPHLVDIGETK